MITRVDTIAPGIHRFSTHFADIAPPEGFGFNQFLIEADEPLLYHCGMRGLFDSVHGAVARIMPVERLRWISFGHVEADESGAMNQWLAASTQAQVVHSMIGCELSIADMADRPPRGLQEDEVLDLGGKRVRFIPTPHVPHGWDAGVLFEETTRTLFCGDLLSHTGDGPALVQSSILDKAIATDELFQPTAVSAQTAPTLRRLATLEPRVLAVMHGSSYSGDGGALLRQLADYYEARWTAGQRSRQPA